MDPKKVAAGAAKSKTMYFAAAVAVLGQLQAHTEQLQALMTPEAYGWVSLAIATGIGALRVFTNKPLEHK